GLAAVVARSFSARDTGNCELSRRVSIRGELDRVTRLRLKRIRERLRPEHSGSPEVCAGWRAPVVQGVRAEGRLRDWIKTDEPNRWVFELSIQIGGGA